MIYCQWGFAYDGVDHGTRFICVHDSVDTGDEDWETTMHTAVLRYGLEVPTTRRRVRGTAAHAFDRSGMAPPPRPADFWGVL